MAIVAATSTVTVNPAFLQEIKEVHHELWARLAEVRHILSQPVPFTTPPQEFVNLLADLRDQLALLFALEEGYGYFDGPVFVAPQLGYAAESLRAQHRELYLEFNQLVEQAERYAFRGQLKSWILVLAGSFMRFHQRFMLHESRENDLIQQAYDDDLGGSG